MGVSRYKCPHCGGVTEISERPWDEKLTENLPKSLLKAVAVTAATVVTLPAGGIGGLILGSVFYGNSVVKFFNGQQITCGKCGKTFKS